MYGYRAEEAVGQTSDALLATQPAMHSKLMPATRSDLKPATRRHSGVSRASW
jgi:hypothetical protein